MARRKRTVEAETVAQAENGAVLEDEVVSENAEQVMDGSTGETNEQGDQFTPEAEGHKCAMCGRTLTAEQSVTRGLGPLCATHVARALGITVKQLSITDPSQEGYVAEDVVTGHVEKLKNATVRYAEDVFDPSAETNVHPDFPEQGELTFMKLTDLGKLVTEQNRSMALFIKAFGGDRGLSEPSAWYFKPVYAGRVRYVPSVAAEHLEDIPLKRERKAKEEVAETSPEPAAEPVAEAA